MTSDALILSLGKTGDLISLLPLFREKSKTSPVIVMVSKDYASVFDGISYVSPIAWEGGAHEIKRAYSEALSISPNVTVAQVCGPKEQLMECVLSKRKETANGWFRGGSFEESLWDCLGAWPDFYKGWPLVFDKRDKAREQKLCEEHLYVSTKTRARSLPKKKILLVSTGRSPGQKASPLHFQFKPLLMMLLTQVLNRHWHIVDLDTIKAERIYDLLGLYEKAHMLVATDNAPLHLAYACRNLAVCALIQDEPAPWCGSAWRPNHVFHCRYKDFPKRVTEFVEAVNGLWSASCFMAQKRAEGTKVVHVWSKYGITDENSQAHLSAKENWQQIYQREGNWISLPIEIGMLGRDSEKQKLEGGRYPYLKDVLRLVKQRAEPGSAVVFTRPDTHLQCVPVPGTFAKRTTRRDGRELVSPWVDMVAFPAERLSGIGELPDLVMGPDKYWADVLRVWSGAKETEGVIWREAA